MPYGLTQQEFESILNVFRQHPEVEKAVLFGSRAMQNFRPGSDVDIAIYSDQMSFNDFLSLKNNIDDLEILQKIDLVKFESIDSADLKDHILRVGVCIYNRKSEFN